MVVAATNQTGRGVFSEETWATPRSDDVDPPGPPVNLRLVAVGDGSATVSWDAPEATDGQAAPTGYQVPYREIATEPGSQPAVAEGWWGSDHVDAAAKPETTVRDLTNGVWYEMRVESLGGGWSEETLTARPGAAPTDAGLPNTPVDVAVVEEASGSVTIAWEPPDDDGDTPVTGYEVWYIRKQDRYPADTEDIIWKRSAETLPPDTRRHTIKGLVDYQQYIVVVAATNQTGRGVFSEETWATPRSDDVDPPGPPVNLRLVAVGDGSATVSWDAPEATDGQAAPTGYQVPYREIATEPGSQPAVAEGWWGSDHVDAAAKPETTVRDLTNGVWYEMRVESLGGGWSEETLTARPGAAPTDAGLPNTPVDVAVVEEASGSVTIAWEPPDDDGDTPVTGYEVWYIRKQDRYPADTEDIIWKRSAETLPPDTRRHTIKGLVDYQQYIVVVAATNQTGHGVFSEETWAIANGDDLDPLGLIAHHRFARAYSLGTDTWEVWICDTTGGHEDVDLEATVALLNKEIPPYFSWLSGARYKPKFISGGTAKSAGDLGEGTHYSCHRGIATGSVGTADGGLVVSDTASLIAYGSPGLYHMSDGLPELDLHSFPENERFVQVEAHTVLRVSEYCNDCGHPDHIDLDFVAHEMGHALGWPHTFGGNRTDLDGNMSEGDNPMDLLSGGPADPWISTTGLVAGTIAVNRYAAGWIDPGDVAVHDSEIASYLLAPIGVSSTQMLALPTGISGYFISLGARVAKGFDRGITAEGVEVYRVDQRSSACPGDEHLAENPDRLRCTGILRRTQQIPPPPNNDQELGELTDHVYGPGDGLTVEGFRIEVTERVGDRFRVWVGNPYTGTFADDENNVHEEDIENLVELGITQGCDPGLKLYCPDQPLTRAHMAKFLILALGEDAAPRSGPSRFTDVAADAWHRPFVERLAELEITVGFSDGTFRPDDPVTRGQMALFLTRAFDGLAPEDTPTGVFEDVPPEASYAAAVEGIRAAGVTKGCNKPPGHNYCPSDLVRRGQIASFLTRALRA